ncbi:hypothetical protein ACFOUR_08850 [Halovivax cerinus]|uniref:NUDIX hydrolase n=1 Tax=Halovivax cerinus TaxID=1487865 RepID=A0ABD5NN71_9EURY
MATTAFIDGATPISTVSHPPVVAWDSEHHLLVRRRGERSPFDRRTREGSPLVVPPGRDQRW